MPLRIVLVLDKSGSMGGSNLQQLLQAATNVILQLGKVDGTIGELLLYKFAYIVFLYRRKFDTTIIISSFK